MKVHPWRLTYQQKEKLKSARKEQDRLRSLRYRNDNLEKARLDERLWHRKKNGLPLEPSEPQPPWKFHHERTKDSRAA